MHDRLAASSYKSWSNYKLWRVYAVLWLLGAYLEYLRLVVNRMRAQNRAEYIALMQPHRLAGGGFEPFFTIQEQIDTLIDEVDPDNEADVDRTVSQIKALFDSFPWMPTTFRDLLNGKTFLPDNKLRPNLLDPGTGFMGSGAYREHFFAGQSLPALLGKAAADFYRYSRRGLARRRRTQARLASQTRPG
jgi:FADH2 O2-dependent halogenase